MARASSFVVCGYSAAVLLLSGGVVQAQSSRISVNPQLAQRGKSLYTSVGCTICHSLGKGKTVAGPDLLGVTDRRSEEWLRRWLRAPETMYDSDSIAKSLVYQANGAKMPNQHLKDADIDALVNYLAQETEKKR
jgi:cytochrome c2